MQWTRTGAKFSKEFSFDNFTQAIDFIVKVGDIAESQGHHPDIHLVNYSHVVIETSTHDQGNKITQKDKDLVSAIDAIILTEKL